MNNEEINIAWIFPVEQQCGISFYAHDYINALKKYCTIHTFTISNELYKTQKTLEAINKCDLVHIQYETSFFKSDNYDNAYALLCSRINCPIIVSLHEIYSDFPGVFPRSGIKGSGIIRKIKEIIYDFKHPYQTTYKKDLSHSFYSDTILVHAKYHKKILEEQGIVSSKIKVLPHPIKPISGSESQSVVVGEKINFTTSGFITQTYNFKLLFDTLSEIKIPWHFTWIGGTRRNEDVPFLQSIKTEILRRNMADNITITGWVSENKRNTLLGQMDIYLALFSTRSSSGSLATALAARKLIIVSEIPYISDIVNEYSVVSVVKPLVSSIVSEIMVLIHDTELQNKRLEAIDTFIQKRSYRNMAQDILSLYKELKS